MEIIRGASDKIIFDQSRDSLVRVFDPWIRFQSLGSEPDIPGSSWQTKNRRTRFASYRRTFTAYHGEAREFQRKLPSSSRRDETGRDPNERRTERGTKTARISRGQLADSSATMRQPSSSETVLDAFWRGQKSRNRSIRHGRILISRFRRLPSSLAVGLPFCADN